MQTGKPLDFGPVFWITGVLWVGGVSLFQFVRYGRRVFSLARNIFLAGYFFFAGTMLAKSYVTVPSELENIGVLLMLTGWLPSLFDFKRRRVEIK